VIEKIVNHVSGSFAGVVGVYQRHTFSVEMAEALARWAQHVHGLVGGARQRRRDEEGTALMGELAIKRVLDILRPVSADRADCEREVSKAGRVIMALRFSPTKKKLHSDAKKLIAAQQVLEHSPMPLGDEEVAKSSLLASANSASCLP
jgi:hypothetical protein